MFESRSHTVVGISVDHLIGGWECLIFLGWSYDIAMWKTKNDMSQEAYQQHVQVGMVGEAWNGRSRFAHSSTVHSGWSGDMHPDNRSHSYQGKMRMMKSHVASFRVWGTLCAIFHFHEGIDTDQIYLTWKRGSHTRLSCVHHLGSWNDMLIARKLGLEACNTLEGRNYTLQGQEQKYQGQIRMPNQYGTQEGSSELSEVHTYGHMWGSCM